MLHNIKKLTNLTCQRKRNIQPIGQQHWPTRIHNAYSELPGFQHCCRPTGTTEQLINHNLLPQRIIRWNRNSQETEDRVTTPWDLRSTVKLDTFPYGNIKPCRLNRMNWNHPHYQASNSRSAHSTLRMLTASPLAVFSSFYNIRYRSLRRLPFDPVSLMGR